ncbi:hypothetical protein C0991_010519 [Blastosporella zonata]|nr:hypothetical protein C0991_010519 [Blastosporella zonata]
MTSRNSTFPYDARDSTKFLKLLRSFRDARWSRQMRHRSTMAASKHRFETHYGEQHARLSRDQAILVDTAKENRTVHILTSMLSFKTSDYYVSRLNNIYVDHLVYVHQWQPFMQKCIEDWRYLSYLLIYLQNVRSDSFKFQWVAFVYALPKTLFFWGILGSIINCFVATSVFIAGDTAWHSCFLALSSLSLLAVMAFQDITSDKKFLGLPNFKLGWGSTEDDETLPV